MTNLSFLTSSTAFKTVAICSILALSACGGPGGSVSRESTYTEFVDEFNTLSGNPAYAGARTDPATLPASGSSTYNGVMGLRIVGGSSVSPGSDLGVIGDLQLTADFQTDEIDGNVVAFVDSDSDTYSGSIVIDADILNGATSADASIFGSADGTLQNDRTGDQFVLNGQGSQTAAIFVGDFYGPNAENLFGVVRGTLDTPDGTLLLWDNDSQGTPDGSVRVYGQN